MKSIINIALLIIVSLMVITLLGCSFSESRIKKEIEKANYCEIAEDCVDVGGKCPFGCFIHVNKNEADRIKNLVDSFDSKCIYDCMSCFNVECKNNKCTEVCE